MTQKAFWEATLTLAMPTETGACIQSMSVPMVDVSDLRCLWGLSSLISSRGIIDLTNNQLYFCGPGDVEIKFSSGSSTVTMERDSRSGHLIDLCNMYETAVRH